MLPGGGMRFLRFLKRRRPLVFHVVPCNPGNQIFRYMFASYLREHRPQSRICGFRMPDFGLVSDRQTLAERLPRTGHLHKLDVAKLLADAERHDGLIIDCYAQRLEYIEHQRHKMSALLRPRITGHKTSKDELVINVRAGEILQGIHPDYMPLPIAYYRDLARATGLRPVFVGQVHDDPYGKAIRAAFPEARFLRSSHWIEDFQTVRHATNVVVAVSSFSWLAAWLSETAKTIHLPLAGFLNPEQRPDVDLLPSRDSRYVIHPFAVEKFAATPEQMSRILG
jgi:hypothetical protein